MMPKGHVEIRVHKIHGYDATDKIVVPVLYSHDGDKKKYDREQMQEYLDEVIVALEKEEEKK